MSLNPVETYWIVIAGLRRSGKTTFMQGAADAMTLRDNADMSVITPNQQQQVMDWLSQTGSALDPYRNEQSEDEQQFTRWARRVSVGEIHVGSDLNVCLYETPATRDFDFLWRVMTPDTYLGAVIVLDSTDHLAIRDASRLASAFATYAKDAPYIFAANKQDEQRALSIADIRTLLTFLDKHKVPIIPCNATDVWSVKRTLIRLLELIRETYDDGIEW
ncbi:MAG: hypothetical protein AAF125_17835 [Chloroflexota bacterium]